MLSTSSPVNDPGDLESIFISTSDGRYVPMSTIATLTEGADRALARPRGAAARRHRHRRAEATALPSATPTNEAVQIAAAAAPRRRRHHPAGRSKTIGDNNQRPLHHLRLCAGDYHPGAGGPVRSVWGAVIVMATVPFGLACADGVRKMPRNRRKKVAMKYLHRVKIPEQAGEVSRPAFRRPAAARGDRALTLHESRR